MFWHAKNGYISIGDTTIDYITFGSERKNLVIIPGLGDGLTTVKGMAMAITIKLLV